MNTQTLLPTSVIILSWALTGLAQQPDVPSGLRAEQELPSRYPYVVEDLLRYCQPEKGFWIDLGAGKGPLAIPLIEKTGNPIVMLDPDVEAMAEGLGLAREKGLQNRLLAVVGVAEDMPFPDNSVDLVASRGSIFFWDDPVKGLREVYRVLRPGAKAYIGGGAGSGYPEWATKKLIQQRKQDMEGEQAEKWRRFDELRRPEQMRTWAEGAGLPEFQVLGRGAISAQDTRVGQGVWLLFEKLPEVVASQHEDQKTVTRRDDTTDDSITSPGGIGGVINWRGTSWPQLLHDAGHTGDAAGEQLEMPLELTSQVKLEDAVLTSPAVVGGRVFVVDQMGTAYCVDPDRGEIVWRSAPDGEAAVGGNTSSPCVAGGRVFYGTTAGNLHLLDAGTGQSIKRIEFGQPILGSITLANESVYVQTLDSVVYCLDLDGNRRWRWDHYNVFGQQESTERPTGEGQPRDPTEKPQYGGVAVSVSGSQVVMAIGYDLVCVEDQGTEARHIWTAGRPISTTYLPVGTTISGGHVYCAFPGKDGMGAFLRVSLTDGSFDEATDVLRDQWAVTVPAAVRGQTAYFSRQAFGVTAHCFGSDGTGRWSSFSQNPESFTPSISSAALSRDHCVFTTLYGQLIAVPLDARGRGLNALGSGVFRFQTPHGSPISSAPAIANGRVYFGCDDGYLYVLGGGHSIQAQKEPLTLHQRRSQITPAGQRRYGWPSAFGGPHNANFVDDSGLEPPLKLRWAMRSGGLFKQPVCATEDDVTYVTLGGLVVCREQHTGRIRWRRKLPKQAWCRSALLCADGKVFVPRMFSKRYPKVNAQANTMVCLDQETGKLLWERPIGIGDRLRASPVFADGVVAYGSLYQEGEPPTFRRGAEAIGQGIDAWDANTGQHLWQVNLDSSGKFLNGPAGCVGDGTMFFTGGGEDPGGTGQTVAIAPRTGKVLWRTSQAFASQTGTPSFQNGNIYLPGTYKLPLACLAASDGRIVWQQDEGRNHWYVDAVSLGPDYFTVNNKYEGGAKRWNLADGTLAGTPERRIQIWGPAHGCGSVVLTSTGFALSATNGGLYMTDTRTGEVRWSTPGFASFTCPHAIVSNGRIFYCPQTSGMMFCFEPVGRAAE